MFESIVEKIPDMGKSYHQETLLRQAARNRPFVEKSIRDLPKRSGPKQASCIIVSAGPSVRRKKSIRRIKASQYQGSIIAVDGAYVACLEEGLFPDFVMAMDPHPTRVVRWFGDPNLEKNSVNDDYFKRQDLDVEFRNNATEKNQRNIDWVNRYACRSNVIACTVLHTETVVARMHEAKFPLYWWNPLVDDPENKNSLTKQLYDINPVACLNTGGTVGNAAWVFAHDILQIPSIALVGMDYGYYGDTPIEQTQTYYELKDHVEKEEDLKKCFISYTFPLTGERFYTDPTYFWYRQNLLELLEGSKSVTVNCTEGGTLIDDRVPAVSLDQYLKDFSNG